MLTVSVMSSKRQPVILESDVNAFSVAHFERSILSEKSGLLRVPAVSHQAVPLSNHRVSFCKACK